MPFATCPPSEGAQGEVFIGIYLFGSKQIGQQNIYCNFISCKKQIHHCYPTRNPPNFHAGCGF
jgi:hypothetical protein